VVATNINKTNNHLSLQLIEHRKTPQRSVIVSRPEYCWFDLKLGQNNDFEIGIYCLSAKNTALQSKTG
jgi:hypothetical protein